MGRIDQILAAKGIDLPEPSKPGANYVPFIREGDLVFITGQLSQWNGERKFIGKVGYDFGPDEGREAVRLAALNVLAQLREACGGNLDRVRQCVRVAVYVNSDPGFHGQSQLANGASDLFLEVFAEAGRHTRMAIGVASLPYNVAAEVEGVFAID
ncbi:MAG: RidA family protein [Pseudomonadota bacterium]